MAKGVYLAMDLLRSKAWRAIKSPASIRVLMELYLRRVIIKRKTTRGQESVIINNGEIVYTYAQAAEHNIPQTTFSRAVGELVSLGFIDVTEQSGGLHRQPNKYAISDRWRLYGTDKFTTTKRTKIVPYSKKKKNTVTTYGS